MTTPENEKLLTEMIALSDSLQTLVDAAAGYRQKCVEAGFSETASEAMAVDLHKGMIAMAFGGVGA